MNNKQSKIYEALDIVVGCCKLDVEGEDTITKEDVLGPNRSESVIMTRCIFVSQMRYMGYSKTTIAKVLHRSEKSVDNMLKQAGLFRDQYYAYRIADAESTLKIKEIIGTI